MFFSECYQRWYFKPIFSISKPGNGGHHIAIDYSKSTNITFIGKRKKLFDSSEADQTIRKSHGYMNENNSVIMSEKFTYRRNKKRNLY